jgi:hypothetical protein
VLVYREVEIHMSDNDKQPVSSSYYYDVDEYITERNFSVLFD